MLKSVRANEASAPTVMTSKEIMAKYGTSFYWASFFLGPALAGKAAQLYKFCRFADDLADGDALNRHSSLADILRCLQGAEGDVGAEIQEFLNFASENDLPLTPAQELLEGFLRDQIPAAFTDEAELLRYCHAVAGTVGLMMCNLLGCTDRRAESFAIDLGIAMQLTNIARDVLEDAARGRRYLPASWVNATASEIADASVTLHTPVALAIEKTLDLAEHYYASGRVGLHLLPVRSRFAIAVALRCYRQIGIDLRRRHLCWWQGRVYVRTFTKLYLTVCSLTDLIPAKVPTHNQELHKELKGLAGVRYQH